MRTIRAARDGSVWYDKFAFDSEFFWSRPGIADSIKARARYILKTKVDYQKKLACLFHLMGLSAGGRLLSVGAGTGLDLLEWARKSIQITALEISPELVHNLNGLYSSMNLPIDVLLGRAEKLDIADETFDCIFTENAFEHFAYPIQALMEQYRTLKPGGKILIVDGNLLQVIRVWQQIWNEPSNTAGKAGGIGWLWKKSIPRDVYGSGYLCRDEDWHTPGWWRQRLTDAGFCDIETATTSYLYHPRRPPFLHPFLGQCLAVARKPG